MVLYAKTETGQAVWVTSWPFGEYVRHAWPGAWVCSAFRNEGAGVASEMIRDALACTVATYGLGAHGMVTFINRKKVRPTKVRGVDVWGWTFLRAGFRACGETAGGLMALWIDAADMPAPALPELPLMAFAA